MFTKTMVTVLAAMLCITAFGIGQASAEELDIEDMVRIETGSTTEWDGGDYVALNMTGGEGFAWFGVVYGNETHDNSVTIVSAHMRLLGGAEMRSEDGGMMIPEMPIPVMTVFVQKLALLIEFSDDGYLDPWSNELKGAENGLFDFEGSGSIVDDDFDIGSVEPVHKILDLNRSWELSEIEETTTLGTTEKEWTFTLSNKNLLYDQIWDNEPAENEDGSRAGRESDGKVHDVAFTFHLGTKLDEFNASIPWYRVNYGDDGIVASEQTGFREFNGTSLQTEFKFDHRIKDWDYQDGDNFLMLETFTAFGTFIPDFVQNWMDVEFVNSTAEEAIVIAEIETFSGGEQDIAGTDGIPNESTRLSKDSVVFRDNWQKIGEMSWVSNVTVDGEEKEMYFQIHAGENIQWDVEDEDGNVNGIVFLGGYIYPMGHDIYHDPSYETCVLFLDIGANGADPMSAFVEIYISVFMSVLIIGGVIGLAYVELKRFRGF